MARDNDGPFRPPFGPGSTLGDAGRNFPPRDEQRGFFRKHPGISWGGLLGVFGLAAKPDFVNYVADSLGHGDFAPLGIAVLVLVGSATTVELARTGIKRLRRGR